MKQTWINEHLCSIGDADLVRIELGPQVIHMPCNESNISNAVTSAHYQVGALDALGKIIVMGETMACVDWRAKLQPKVWKVYQQTDGGFVKVDQTEDKQQALALALALAEQLTGEM